MQSPIFSICLGGRLHSWSRPAVMGIINVTPDSFYEGSRVDSCDAPDVLAARVRQMVADGADIIDVGGYSTRPGCADVSAADEFRRLDAAMAVIRSEAPDIPVSVDTFRASVAADIVRRHGAVIINDISGGNHSGEEMWRLAADHRLPYVLMHMRGATPARMMDDTTYTPGAVAATVMRELAPALHRLSLLGVSDVIVDPGFGFSKTVEQNLELLRSLPLFAALERPLLVGVSRKSMLTKPLSLSPSEALNATTVADTIALLGGASILRVHDVAEARQAVDLVTLTFPNLHSSAIPT